MENGRIGQRFIIVNHSGGVSALLAGEFIRQLQAAIPGVRVLDLVVPDHFQVHEAGRMHFCVSGLQFGDEYGMRSAQVTRIVNRIANAPPAPRSRL